MPSGLTIKTALVLGFSLTLGLWLFAGYQFTRRIADVEQRAASINARYVRAQDLLTAVRTNVLLGSVYVRDAVANPDPAPGDDLRRKFDETSQAVDAALVEYVRSSPEDAGRITALRAQYDAFRGEMLTMLATRPDLRTFVNPGVTPRRNVVINMSEEIQSLNRQAYVQQQVATNAVYVDAQRQVWIRLGLALLASLGITILATWYAGRLERRLRDQQVKDQRQAGDLQRLSAQLVNAQEDERRTIARELHDEVGQALTAIKVELALAERALPPGTHGAPRLADARAITERALHTVRDLSHLLHPPLIDDLGLVAVVDWHLKAFARRHGIGTELVHHGLGDRLTADLELAAYRIVQEALTNVARHAHATACRVSLRRLPQTVLVSVEDDGCGFDPEANGTSPTRHGLGLIGIRERVAQLGGTLRIESGAPPSGTRITVVLPAQTRARLSDPPAVAGPEAREHPALETSDV